MTLPSLTLLYKITRMAQKPFIPLFGDTPHHIAEPYHLYTIILHNTRKINMFFYLLYSIGRVSRITAASETNNAAAEIANTPLPTIVFISVPNQSRLRK